METKTTPVAKTAVAPQNGPHAGHFLYGLVIAVVLAAAVILGFRQVAFAHGTVVIDGKVNVRVSVASNDRSRERGLSGRKSLAADEGMLFLFDRPDTFAFWMKEMLFPIDILWISGTTVADMTTDVPIPVPGERLPLYSPRVPVDKVLEVPAGFARAHGLKVGMPMDIRVDSRDGVR
jgi:uncharacterized membrane protein (UPF0127 family)